MYFNELIRGKIQFSAILITNPQLCSSKVDEFFLCVKRFRI